MTKIDETTGLAALPEDMLWRIEESELSTGSYHRSVGAVRLILVKKTVRVYESVTRHRDEPNSFWKHFFTGQRYTSVPYQTKAESVTTEQELRSADFLITADEVPEGETGWTPYTYYDGWGGDYVDGFYRVVPPTAELLRKNSFNLWEKYLEGQYELALEEDHRRELDSILGDYPPKSVKDLVNS